MNPRGVPDRAIEAAAATGFIALSDPVYAEMSAVLSRPKFARGTSDLRRVVIMQRLNAAAVWVKPNEIVRDCRDPGDDKYLELALAARATTIITGDKDLLVLHPWRAVPILSPADFLAAKT